MADEYLLDSYFDFTFLTQTPATGAQTDADALPTYRVYEEGNDTAVATGDCVKRDDDNTVGYYAARAQVTTEAGYEVGKTYEVRVVAIMATVSGSAVVGRFKVVPADTVRDDVWTDARAGYLTTLNTCLAGITSLAAWLRLLGRKDTGDSTARTELNTGGGEYSEATDSLEAIRDRGDAAWDTYVPAGTGAHTVTVTVMTSGLVTFEGIRVSASGVDETNQYTETTDTNGQVVFYLNAGTWRFVAAASKAQTGGAVNQVVDGIESVTLTVVANTIPEPASPSNFTLYNYETEVENGDIPLVGMLVQIVGLSGGRVSATNNLIRNLMYHTSTTGADGLWSFQIPLALNGYQIDVLRMTVGDDGLPHSEIMKAVIDTTKVSSGVLSFADLSPE